ncbi:MAG: hypothetical protein CVU56_21845 [Deltaproteobacteria bacterium HGW-Deltaproteobacteria-14]|jgi:hypothetical protein|nr:MAG: hypothetical protein CVU56_21845 [Deltaproteobacteria bacterium HGW-Deltaproteobacteria-14]
MLALTSLALLLATAATPVDPAVDQVVLGDRVVVPIPQGYEAEESALGDDRWLVTLRGAGCALTVAVYGGTRPPNHGTALTVHTEELTTRLRAETPNEASQRLLGHTVTARDLRYTLLGAPWRARVAAATKDRRTVVVSATWPDASPDRETLLGAIEAIVVRAR